MVNDKEKSDIAPKSASQPIKEWPATERPREKLLQIGPEGLSDGELLAVLRSHTMGIIKEQRNLGSMARFAEVFPVNCASVLWRQLTGEPLNSMI